MNHRTDNELSSRKWSARLLYAVVAGVVLVLLCYSLITLGDRNASAEKLAQLSSRMQELTRLAKAKEEYPKILNGTEEVFTLAVGDARSAEDMPEFDLEKIFVDSRVNRTMIWVPDGNHSLVITGYWQTFESMAKKIAEVNSIGDKSPTEYAETAILRTEHFEGAASKQWRIPLNPNAGYLFAIKHRKRKKSLHWELTSNDSTFSPHSEPFPFEFIKQKANNGYVVPTGEFPLLPNEVLAYTDVAKNIPSERRIRNSGFSFLQDKKKMNVFITAGIVSDSEPCVERATAIRMLQLGMGRYLKAKSEQGYRLDLDAIEDAKQSGKPVKIPRP